MNGKQAPPIDDHEWETQERGMRAARGPGKDPMDPAAESYRRVALAVIRAPRREPPADFVAGVVEQVARREAGIERALFRGLLLVLAAASVIVTALYGGQWWRAVQQASAGGALPWIMAGTGCVTLSWMIGQLHQLLTMRVVEPRP
ncbi:hypothetical protein [Lysobacter sp. D1-1-M9]|uniref:hypothetical protein n=1 Tax=Novilysobacter longmucuonensis TaxID=3098603 RepID=UPI002FC9D568